MPNHQKVVASNADIVAAATASFCGGSVSLLFQAKDGHFVPTYVALDFVKALFLQCLSQWPQLEVVPGDLAAMAQSIGLVGRLSLIEEGTDGKNIATKAGTDFAKGIMFMGQMQIMKATEDFSAAHD